METTVRIRLLLFWQGSSIGRAVKECKSCSWLLQQSFFPLQGTCWWFESTPCHLCGAYSNHLDITANYENQKHHEKIMGHLQQLILK
nr:MAG TPA: hypothetical protein [Caudoviricetes sp.]